MKLKTINIEPCSVETTKLNSNNKFSIVVKDHNKIIRVNLEFWWIRFIAEELNKTIAEAQSQVDLANKAMKGYTT